MKCRFISGSVTIYFSLTFTLTLSLLLATIQSAMHSASLAYVENCTYFALESLFANYTTQLFDKYGIFALNTTSTAIRGELEDYISYGIDPGKNFFYDGKSLFEASLDEVVFNNVMMLTDRDGEVFIEQVLEYMNYKELENISDYLFTSSDINDNPTEYFDGDFENDSDDTDTDNILSGNLYQQIKTANEANDEDNSIDSDNLKEIYGDTFGTDAINVLSHIFNETLIYVLVDDPLSLSTKTLDISDYPSAQQERLYEELDSNYEPKELSLYDKFLFTEYIANVFSSYATKRTSSLLDYQTEYAITGMDNDKDNLCEVARHLILYRFGFNCIHIISDSEKLNLTLALSETLSFIPGLPIAMQVVLVSLWAFSEAILDVKDLLAGKKVPLIKSLDQWTLDLDGILDLNSTTTSINTGEEGLDYDTYLKLVLLNTINSKTYFRTMDLIQMDFSTNINENFKISNCITGIDCSIKYLNPEVTINQTYLYH